MASAPWSPVPPLEMPPARTVHVLGRGEFFLRDSGGAGRPVLLLHGWLVTADLNWWAAYDDLAAAGYRVLAIDHRGHGRGLRSTVPFRLKDCADDAAAVLRALSQTPALVVGYSMGGAIAQLLARDHPEVVEGVVLSATAQHWQDPRTKRHFRGLGALGLSLALFPRQTYNLGVRRAGIGNSPQSTWLKAELMRGEARDLTEAGRELGRFDSRSWLGTVRPPVAVVLTSLDELVEPRKQLQLAAAGGARVFDVPLTHMELSWRPSVYNPALLAALRAVTSSTQAWAA